MANPLIEAAQKRESAVAEKALGQVRTIREFIESKVGTEYLVKKFVNVACINSRGFIRYETLYKRVMMGEVIVLLREVFGNQLLDLAVVFTNSSGASTVEIGSKVWDEGKSTSILKELTDEGIIALLGRDGVDDFYRLLLTDITGETVTK